MKPESEHETPVSSSAEEAENDVTARLLALKGEMSESEFARKCKVPLSSMRKYLAGSMPGIDRANHIANNLGVSLSWLATGEGPMELPDWQREAHDEMVQDVVFGDQDAYTRRRNRLIATLELVGAAKSEGIQAIMDEFAMIPVYDVRAAAGHGAALDDEQVVSRLAFRWDWLSKEGLKSKGLAAITAAGDSMEPTVPDGSVLLVDTDDDYPRDGIYVLRLDGGLVVKRLQRLQDGLVRVKSDNAAYDPVDVNVTQFTEPPHMESFRIIGRVVWIGRRV